jgi:hypothetical protein
MKKFPKNWNEDKVRRVIDHYEAQSEEEAVAEDQAALATEETTMQVPVELVGDVRALIARGAKHKTRCF